MQYTQNRRRSDLLVNGFVGFSQLNSHSHYIPSGVIQIIADFYRSVIVDWIDQDVIIELVESEHDSQLVLHFGGFSFNFMKPIVNHECEGNYSDAIWRLYPVPEHDGGFIVRNVDIDESEDIALNDCDDYLGILSILSFCIQFVYHPFSGSPLILCHF